MAEKLTKKERRALARANRENSIETRLGLPPLPAWLTVKDVDVLGADKMRQAVQAVLDWHYRFKFEQSLTLGAIPEEEREFEQLDEERIVRTVDLSTSGSILIDPSVNKPYNTVLHSMTHASKPNQLTELTEPIDYPEGQIIGFKGLDLRVKLTNGDLTWYPQFEEGMCERNAASFRGYTVSHRGYFNIGNLTARLLPHDSYRRAHNWVRTNDVPSFTRSILKLPETTPVDGDRIWKAIRMYEDAWHS